MCWCCRTLPLPVNVRQSSCPVQGPQNKHIYLDGDGSSNQPAKLQNSAHHSGSIQVIDQPLCKYASSWPHQIDIPLVELKLLDLQHLHCNLHVMSTKVKCCHLHMSKHPLASTPKNLRQKWFFQARYTKPRQISSG